MRATLLLSLALGAAPADRWGPFAVFEEERVARVVSDAAPGWERRFALPGGHDLSHGSDLELGPGPDGRLMLAYGFFRQEWEDGGGEYGVRLFDVDTRKPVRVPGANRPYVEEESPSVWGRWLAVSVEDRYRENAPRLRLFDLLGRRVPVTLRRPRPPECVRTTCHAQFAEVELRRNRVAFVWRVYGEHRDDLALYVADRRGGLRRYTRARRPQAIRSLELTDRTVSAVVNGRRVSFALR